MKKILLLGFVTLTLGLTSCLSDNSTETTKFTVMPVNLITYMADGSTNVAMGSYVFDINISDQNGSVAASNLVIDNQSLSFTASDLKYASSGYDLLFKNFTTTTTGSMTYNVDNTNFLATPLYYYPGMFGINSPYNPNTSFSFPYYLAASYRVDGNYVVKTIAPNTFYKGNTRVTYTNLGSMESYQNEDMLYGLILNIQNKTATIVIYNAMFSSDFMKRNITVSNLPVDFTNGTINVRATNVTSEDNSCTFQNISFMSSSADLTMGTVNFDMTDNVTTYSGTFTGSYLTVTYEDK